MHLMRILFLCGIVSFAASPSFCQQPSQPRQVDAACATDASLLKSLIVELQQLRQEQRIISNHTHRLLVLGDHSSRQQTRIDSLTQEISQLKLQINNVDDGAKDEEALKSIESALNETADAPTRIQLTQTYAMLRTSFEKQKKAAEDFLNSSREKLQQLEAKLVEEQTGLAAIKEEMTRLNQDLERLATK